MNNQELIEAFGRNIWVIKRQLEGLTHINFSSRHEIYHVGQLEYLRQLAGKNDSGI